jgi:hypothetical protein
MNKKLHRVEIVLYVMAEDEFEACWAATNARFDVFECAAKEATSLEPGWETAVPYNAEDDHTCAEILARKTHAGQAGSQAQKPAAARRRMRMCGQRQLRLENVPGVLEQD